MKTKTTLALLAIVAGASVWSGCVVTDSNGRQYVTIPEIVVNAPPPVYVGQPNVYVQPGPAVTVDVGVPDTYIAVDGIFYGCIGNQYYYLGPSGVWVVCDSFHLGRFHEWERVHPDWRSHAVPNDRFRRDAHGREQPFRPGGRPAPKKGEGFGR
jgi:hypothetical protein